MFEVLKYSIRQEETMCLLMNSTFVIIFNIKFIILKHIIQNNIKIENTSMN
jgi:hypothetical protein